MGAPAGPGLKLLVLTMGERSWRGWVDQGYVAGVSSWAKSKEFGVGFFPKKLGNKLKMKDIFPRYIVLPDERIYVYTHTHRER